MTDAVDQTLAIWRSKPFAWGDADCMLSVGDYVALRGGKDITGIFRGMYDTKEQALAHMHHYGGVAGFMRWMEVPEVDRVPERGDIVALGCEESEGGAIPGICTGDSVAFRRERGVLEVRIDFIADQIVGVWQCRA